VTESYRPYSIPPGKALQIHHQVGQVVRQIREANKLLNATVNAALNEVAVIV
jgi:hypothetical protein